jgi:MerR family mercuric resistance operon transcriptional regulator
VDGHLSIGKLAGETGVNVDTIRFWERQGLIPEPPRTAAGYRMYKHETVRRIHFIRHAKDLGFSLKETVELLSLRMDPGTRCSEVRERTEGKLADIDQKITTLKRMRKVLRRLADSCPGEGPVTECPILEALDR